MTFQIVGTVGVNPAKICSQSRNGLDVVSRHDLTYAPYLSAGEGIRRCDLVAHDTAAYVVAVGSLEYDVTHLGLQRLGGLLADQLNCFSDHRVTPHHVQPVSQKNEVA